MVQTFVNLPNNISESISHMLSLPQNAGWLIHAENLHTRYMTREKNESFVEDYDDVLAYLALRCAATYAQISSCLLQVQELFPSWQPKSLLDIGCGPGTALWAAKTLWSRLEASTEIDADNNFLAVGRDIEQKANHGVDVEWQQRDIKGGLENNRKTYDLVIIANLLNELSASEVQHLLDEAYAACRGIMIVIEPGTPYGFEVVQKTAQNMSTKAKLIAPYISGSFVESKEYWIHFSQRFIRPPFLRRLRQHMRDSELMASDFEEAKYSFVAFGSVPSTQAIWGRCIGPIKKQKGFLEVPILTQDQILQAKVLKRHKPQYNFAKELRPGETIKTSTDLISS